MDTPFGEGAESCFWRVDRPGGAVRPYLESTLYGRWNYPLGVTLYGLLCTGIVLDDSHYTAYSRGHIEQCTRLHEYALWDTGRYGAPGINQQLALIDSLDDCGSFGAAMLAAHSVQPLPGAAGAAEYIARYIHGTQSRDEAGALYRTRGTTDFMQGTMWCDDLYMSTPFLVRYYQLTGNAEYLDDAVAQFLHYRARLFQPELGIMHHVYDYKFGKPNGVPWGRGNGWVLFSLTELLEILPEQHPQRPELLDYFLELCEGYLQLQDAAGLWHQVLTDAESYAEASCSSMFVYAFARGVRRGWLLKPHSYAAAAIRGWHALAEYCIDKQGNVYGVCRGSGYSFNKLYYKEQLTWQLNDTHGIGIVLLAGIEALELTRELEAQKQ
nr:glycoside hydrolase family 88 protein [Paenibacillus phytohabitans]